MGEDLTDKRTLEQKMKGLSNAINDDIKDTLDDLTKQPVKRIYAGGQPVMYRIKFSDLSQEVLKNLRRTKRKHLTPNSKCPCQSGKKFKRCCGKGVVVK